MIVLVKTVISRIFWSLVIWHEPRALRATGVREILVFKRLAAALMATMVTTTAAMAEPLSAIPQRGLAPLAVTFRGNGGGATFFGGLHLQFGDGESAIVCPPGRACRDFILTHVYARPGSYSAKLTGNGEGTLQTFGEISIVATQ